MGPNYGECESQKENELIQERALLQGRTGSWIIVARRPSQAGGMRGGGRSLPQILRTA